MKSNVRRRRRDIAAPSCDIHAAALRDVPRRDFLDVDADRIGCVRRFTLQDGSELREQLLALSDLEQTFSYCLLDTPIPMFNYVAHVRLLPVTDGDRTFWHWESRFTTRPADAAEITEMVGEQIYQAGFEAIRRHLQGAA